MTYRSPFISSWDRIFVEKEFSCHNLLKDAKDPFYVDKIPPLSYPDYTKGDLLVVRHKGSFIRPCPATPKYNCCGLNIFHIGQGCNLGCSYCILASYLGSESIVFFGNTDESLSELEARLKSISDKTEQSTLKTLSSHRFCTGEFTDSLLLDQQSHLSSRLIELFAQYPPALLELKTKTANVEHLLDLKHNNRTVISFSVNSPEVCRKEEPLAAPLLTRLKAAQKAANRGYPIGLHFDPLIYYDGWVDGYQKTINLLNQFLDLKKIAWISLGCFRYLPELKKIMLKTRPSALFQAEFVRGKDGKMRYPRPLRLHIYHTILDFLQPLTGPETIIYLCMESGRLWTDLFGFDPGTEGLTEMFRK